MIVGLTDVDGAFVRMGKVFKGGKKQQRVNAKGEAYEIFGEDLKDHFRFEWNEGREQERRIFESAYSNKPNNILIVLPFDEVDQNWEGWRERYAGGACVHRCNGEYVYWAVNPSTGETLVRNWLDQKGERVRCQLVNAPKRQRCTPTGRFRFLLPEVGRLAYVQLTTHSTWDIRLLSGQLKGISQANGDRLAGVPLIMRRAPYEVAWTTDDGQRMSGIKWLVEVEPAPRWATALFNALELASLGKPPARPELPAPIEAAPKPLPFEVKPGEDDEDVPGGDGDNGGEWFGEPPLAGDEAPANDVRRATDAEGQVALNGPTHDPAEIAGLPTNGQALLEWLKTRRVGGKKVTGRVLNTLLDGLDIEGYRKLHDATYYDLARMLLDKTEPAKGAKQ